MGYVLVRRGCIDMSVFTGIYVVVAHCLYWKWKETVEERRLPWCVQGGGGGLGVHLGVHLGHKSSCWGGARGRPCACRCWCTGWHKEVTRAEERVLSVPLLCLQPQLFVVTTGRRLQCLPLVMFRRGEEKVTNA